MMRSGTNVIRTVLAVAACAASVLGGCAMSRQEQLRAKASRVESSLKQAQERALESGDETSRRARLDYLSELRLTLSAANIGLATIPVVVPPEQREIAYNVLEETYSTIEWNIPLSSGQAKKALPAQFRDGVLKLD